ncbi:MAG TPA: HAMP domain-containing sensor histidine kinase [Polyangia bacterium]
MQTLRDRGSRKSLAAGSLQERYRDLLQRHHVALERLSEDERTRPALLRLSWFGLQRSSSALAMFRGGREVLANPQWTALASARPHVGGWVVTRGQRKRSYANLEALAVAELAKLRASSGVMTLRCERPDRRQTLRVRLERVAPPGEEAVGLVVADVISGADGAGDGVGQRDARKREQMTAIGRVAAGIAHDLGNALNALALRAYSVSRRADVEARRHLRGMNDAIEMMRQTLDRLDRFSGRRSRPLKAIQIAPVIRAAVEVIGLPPAPARRKRTKRGAPAPIRIALELPRRLPRIVGDKAELTNMFVNLLLNARYAMTDGGTITVRATGGKKLVTVRVCDEGPGFAHEHLERVFEPFFTTKGAQGSGLGLSLAYGLMQAIGGSISVGNRPGGGAEIVLELPIAGRVTP